MENGNNGGQSMTQEGMYKCQTPSGTYNREKLQFLIINTGVIKNKELQWKN